MILTVDSGMHPFGKATFYGSATGKLPKGVSSVSLTLDPKTEGYWLLKSNDWVQRFHHRGRAQVSRRWIVAVALAALCNPATAGAVLAPSPISGNPQGVKLAHQVMKAFGRIPAYRQSEQHFFQIKANRKARTFSYLFGDPHHAGYAWAAEDETVAVHHNRVVWWLDSLKPSRRHSSPVELVVNRHGRYWAFGTPSHHTCFTKLGGSNSLPYRYGGLGYSIGGRMGAPRQTATTDILPYVYRWKMHLTATETDTIRRATKLVVAGKVKITRHSGSTVLAFSFANGYPRRAPRAPGVKLCG